MVPPSLLVTPILLKSARRTARWFPFSEKASTTSERQAFSHGVRGPRATDAPSAKEAFIAPITAIKASPLPLMDAGGRQMGEPPPRQKEGEQEPIQTHTITRHAGFQVPAATLALLKSGRDAHARGILAEATPASTLVGNEQ